MPALRHRCSNLRLLPFLQHPDPLEPEIPLVKGPQGRHGLVLRSGFGLSVAFATAKLFGHSLASSTTASNARTRNADNVFFRFRRSFVLNLLITGKSLDLRERIAPLASTRLMALFEK